MDRAQKESLSSALERTMSNLQAAVAGKPVRDMTETLAEAQAALDAASAPMERPGWDTYFLNIAEVIAQRAECTRRKVGAVVVQNNRIKATGYNGAPAGVKSCLDGACPRGAHFAKVDQGGVTYCACGEDWPCTVAPAFDQPGAASYDIGPGTCIAIHAEQNAVMESSPEERKGATLYVTCEPCPGCARMLRGSGLQRVVWPGGMMALGF